MSVTPRRATRSSVFTPSPSILTPDQIQPEESTFRWTSSAQTDQADPFKTHYTSFARLSSTSSRKKAKPSEEKRFALGDGVQVSVDGGEGVGVLIRLWSQPRTVDEDEEESEDGESQGEEDMMGEVHWVFRREDMPGIMKNVSVEDVSLQID